MVPAPKPDPLLALLAARMLAWALLLSGWIGLGSLFQNESADLFQGFLWLALWVLALGAWTGILARLTPGVWARRLALAAAALVASASLAMRPIYFDGVRLLVALVFFALLVALASVTVRACRLALRERPGSPVASAASGAVLAWWILGDPTDSQRLAVRLSIAGCAAAIALIVLHPARIGQVAARGCRAALFDCSLPNWGALAPGRPEAWVASVALISMVPMMCSLTLLGRLCSAAAISPGSMLGIHLGAMFLPALTLANSRARPTALPWLSAGLLAGGAAAILILPPAQAILALAILQGSAWSLAWAWRLRESNGSGSPAPGPLRAATFNAACVVAVGALFQLQPGRLAIGTGILFGTAASLIGLAALAHRLEAFRRALRASAGS